MYKKPTGVSNEIIFLLDKIKLRRKDLQDWFQIIVRTQNGVFSVIGFKGPVPHPSLTNV